VFGDHGDDLALDQLADQPVSVRIASGAAVEGDKRRAALGVVPALASRPGAFDVHFYQDAAAARAAIRDRDVYCALVATSAGGTKLLVASAAGPQIAVALTSEAKALGQGHAVPVTDVVPAPRKDPEETGALATLLPLILVSLVLGAVLAFAEPRAWRVSGWRAGASIAAGLAVSGVASGLGTFAGSYWADAGCSRCWCSGSAPAAPGWSLPGRCARSKACSRSS
jgi:hypothetical protein